MNMYRMKDECLLVLLLFAAFGKDVGGFYISHTVQTKNTEADTFMVVCRDDVEGLAITWHSPKGVVLGPKTRPKVESGSYGTSIVFISPLRVEDSGNYTCSSKKEKRVFQLFVEPTLKFTDTATNQTGKEGEDYMLKCEATGGTISWALEGGASIERNKKFKVLADGLLIYNVTRHDSQTYVCKVVQQRTGTVLDRKIHFHVKHKPVHPSHPQKHMRQDVVYGYINGTVNLTCVAIAYPPAKFEWKVNDRKAKIANVINESSDVSILQLHIDSKSVFGNYKCIARNNYGTYEENFTLKQGMKPLVPISFQVKEVGAKEVVLELVGPEMELEVRGFRVKYRKLDEKDWRHKDFNVTQSNVYTLDGLDPRSDYLLQAATRNAAGLSEYLPSMRFTTSKSAPVRVTFFLICTVIFLQPVNLAFW